MKERFRAVADKIHQSYIEPITSSQPIQDGKHLVDEGRHFAEEMVNPLITTVQSTAIVGQNVMQRTKRFLKNSVVQALTSKRVLSAEPYDQLAFGQPKLPKAPADKGQQLQETAIRALSLALFPAALMYQFTQRVRAWAATTNIIPQKAHEAMKRYVEQMYTCRDRHIARIQHVETEHSEKLKQMLATQHDEGTEIRDRVMALAAPGLARNVSDQLHIIANEARHELMHILHTALQHLQVLSAGADTTAVSQSLTATAMTCVGALCGAAIATTTSMNTLLFAGVAAAFADSSNNHNH